MKAVWWLVSFLMTPVLAGLQSGTVTRGGSGIKIGTSDRGTMTSRGYGTRGSSGVRIGEGRLSNSTRQRAYTTTTTTTTTTTAMAPSRFTYAPQSSVGNDYNISYLKVGMMVPYKSFGVRDYTKAVTTAINTLQKSTRGPKLGLFQRYDIHVKISMKELTPSPTTLAESSLAGYGTSRIKIYKKCTREK
ncbi:hypothetical protein KPH14_010190 [Odynerus spinipes]|uniref:SEA domain-containing protein n=1 Tax=Odynerus spinipes TaxID=1348599 RepID=A0AAD9RTH4_9HYME|nr:hypothetical protein KPH14_010190 [Odynerus spinipes]